MDLISKSLHIPLSKLKLIGAGKVLNEENIVEAIFVNKLKKFMVCSLKFLIIYVFTFCVLKQLFLFAAFSYLHELHFENGIVCGL